MKKLTYDFVRQCFEEQGCKLLDKEYKNANFSMCYKCKCGNYCKTNFNNFRRKGRCPKCVGCKKYTLSYIKEFFAKYRCELLESDYAGKNATLKFCCSCGNIGSVSFSNFRRPHHHKCCRECWKKTFKGDKHYKWNPDRESLKLKQLFHRRCCTMLWNALQQTGMKKTTHTKELLGYTTNELQIHIMNHPNWTYCKDEKWDIDHVFPVSVFVKFGIFDHKIINALDNLQPLSKLKNISKSNKYDHNKFIRWLATKGIKEIDANS